MAPNRAAVRGTEKPEKTHNKARARGKCSYPRVRMPRRDKATRGVSSKLQARPRVSSKRTPFNLAIDRCAQDRRFCKTQQ